MDSKQLADRYAIAKLLGYQDSVEPVSYTHLTLPTT